MGYLNRSNGYEPTGNVNSEPPPGSPDRPSDVNLATECHPGHDKCWCGDCLSHMRSHMGCIPDTHEEPSFAEYPGGGEY